MLFDLEEIQRYQESNESSVEKYSADIEVYDSFNELASREVFDNWEWYESLAATIIEISEDDKIIIVNHIENVLGGDFEKFILSHCTTSHDGYDSWIMNIAFDIISKKGKDVDFIKWFSALFLNLSEKRDDYIELEDLTYALWRVWTWYDEGHAKVLFRDLGVDVEELIKQDAEIDEAYYSSW